MLFKTEKILREREVEELLRSKYNKDPSFSEIKWVSNFFDSKDFPEGALKRLSSGDSNFQKLLRKRLSLHLVF